jgi:hypothetical protein
VPCGQEVGRTGRKLPLRTLRAPDLLSLPVAPAAACSVMRVGWVREVFEYARCSGEGATGKATRPTGGLTLTRQKERASAFLPDLPSATRKKMERSALKEPDGRGKHSAFASFLRQSVGCPVLPRWRGLVLSLPRYPGDTSRCGLRPPMKSALRAHDSCTAFVPAETRRSSAR